MHQLDVKISRVVHGICQPTILHRRNEVDDRIFNRVGRHEAKIQRATRQRDGVDLGRYRGGIGEIRVR